MKPETKGKLIIYGILGLVVVVLLSQLSGCEKVEANEAAVLQDFIKGVNEEEVWLDGTHIYMPLKTDVYKYIIGTQKLTFDSSDDNKGADYPSIEVNVGENGGQKAWISLSINYQLAQEITENGAVFNQKKLIALHKNLKDTYKDVILKRTVVEVVNRIARPREALEIFSGDGYNQFVADVTNALIKHPMFEERGILIESVIVYDVGLSQDYEKQVEAKQLAIQTALREKEERKAADEKALRIKSEAQAEVEKRSQAAEAAKIEQQKQAEAAKIKQVLAAEGAKIEQVLAAEARSESDKLVAAGILAKGKAEAEVELLKREALYGGRSGELRAQVDIARETANRMKGLFDGKMILTDKAVVSLSGEDFAPKWTVPVNETN